ncbi:MAG: hypothetical protein IH963_12810 [Chloroflexi bacterium]|nr:hypothetical protein [Chloroflexota bacterium]
MASLESITMITTQLEDYSVFFTALNGEVGDYVFETYGDQLRRSAEEVASIAVAIGEDTSNEALAEALIRTPSFAIASVMAPWVHPSVMAVSGHISTLLSPSEVAELAGGVELTTKYRDLMAGAGSIDPSQVEHMRSFDSLEFTAEGDSWSLSLTTIRFDSEESATDHLQLVTRETPGMQAHSVKIGDASSYIEVNESGVGSFVVFKKGDWVVILHTAQPAGVAPLVDIAQVEALARKVADQL